MRAAFVFARDTQQAVQVFADFEAIVAVGRFQVRWIDAVFGVLTGRRLGHPRGHDRLERLEIIAADHVQLPGLQVSAGRGARGFSQDTPDEVTLHGLVSEAAHRHAGADGLGTVGALLLMQISLLTVLAVVPRRPPRHAGAGNAAAARGHSRCDATPAGWPSSPVG